MYNRHCPFCGEHLQIRSNERIRQFAIRKTCGTQSCVNAFRTECRVRQRAPGRPNPDREDWTTLIAPINLPPFAFADNIQDTKRTTMKLDRPPTAIRQLSSAALDLPHKAIDY